MTKINDSRVFASRQVNWLVTLLTSSKTALRIALVFVAQFCVLRGIGYLPWFGPEVIPAGVQTITVFVPLWVLALMWLLAGLLALCCIPRCYPEGSAGAALMCLVWACGYTVTWIASIEAVRVEHIVFKPLAFIFHAWDGVLRIPYLAIVSDGSPAGRDYLTASQYWFGIGMLSCGYVLARYALASRGSSGRVNT